MFSMSRPIALAATVVASAASAALAAPTFEYRITGTYLQPDGVSATLDDTSYITQNDGSGSNGSMDLSASPFDVTRTEIFSDPSGGFYIPYSAVRTFGYFGLYSQNTLAGRLPAIFVAAVPGTAAAANLDAATSVDPTDSAFSILLASYLATHPNADTPAELLQVLDDGPDFPTPGANIDWIDFNAFVATTDPFRGNVATDFQAGQTLELIAFDTLTGAALTFGDISTSAVLIPEPACLGILAAASLLFARRKKD